MEYDVHVLSSVLDFDGVRRTGNVSKGGLLVIAQFPCDARIPVEVAIEQVVGVWLSTDLHRPQHLQAVVPAAQSEHTEHHDGVRALDLLGQFLELSHSVPP
jgi:hypothetical protein